MVFFLALFDRPLLDDRFDRVEAWRYGPVIPSVYHSFKQYKSNRITEKTVIMGWDDIEMSPTFETPELTDNDAKKVVEMVWKRYHEFSDSELVALTHKDGSPWALCYVPEENRPIPDSFTKLYYQKLISNILEAKRREDENI